jgi:hypothetical protein
MDLIIDPEFAQLIPRPSEEELTELLECLMRDGCRDPIVTWDGIVIDGHNRYRLCKENGIPFSICEMHFDHRDDVIVWMIQTQLGRRSLTAYTRTQLVLKKEQMLKREALERKSAARRKDTPAQKSAGLGETREIIAKEAGVSRDTVAKVKVIEQKADENDKQALAAGETRINAVYKKLVGPKRLTSDDPVVDRAREKVPVLVRNLKLQLGNLGLGGRFDKTLDQIVEAAR